jgi:hypothetical protein
MTRAELREIRKDPEARTLGKIVMEASAAYHEQIAAGVDRATAIDGLERTIRDHWPYSREWKYLCPRCDDTGLVLRTVTNRLGCVVDEGHPCSCALGARFIPKPKRSDDFTAATKVTKPTRFGQR